MKRKPLIIGWITVVLIGLAVHFTAGKKWREKDAIQRLIEVGEKAISQRNYVDAEGVYTEVLDRLGKEEKPTEWGIRLELAKAKLMQGKVKEAKDDLEALQEEVLGSDEVDSELEASVRSALANSKYYLTYLMRLEGHPRERWEAEIESARQDYKLLAENSEDERYRLDLESAIQLARADIGDLQGRAIPPQ